MSLVAQLLIEQGVQEQTEHLCIVVNVFVSVFLSTFLL